MKVCCRDLLSLPSFRHIRLVGGGEGLDRTVRWPYVTLTNTIEQWVHGGELMFVSGIGSGRDENDLLRLLRESAEKNLSGVVILVGEEYIREIPPAVAALADSLALPLFEMPFRIPLVEPTEEISSFIVQCRLQEQALSEMLAGILAGRCASPQEVVSRAAFYRYDLTGPLRVAALAVADGPSQPGKMGPGEDGGLAFMLSCLKTADDILRTHGYRILSMPDCRTLLFLLTPNGSKEANDPEELLLQAGQKIREKTPAVRFAVGVGRGYESLQDMPRSKREAENACRVALRDGRELARYEELGFLKVLFAVEDRAEMRLFYDEALGGLEAYDRENGTNLLETLETYLAEDCNAVRAAQRLFLHRNSLNYRIRKIESVLGCDLSEYETKLRFRDAFMTQKFLDIAE